MKKHAKYRDIIEGKCVICRMPALPHEFRCQKCSDDFMEEMREKWKNESEGRKSKKKRADHKD